MSVQELRTRELSRATSVSLHSAFFAAGLVTALIGPLLPGLKLRFAITDAQAGSLFVAQFAGSSLGSLLSQRRLRVSIFLGLLLIALGVGVLPFADWAFTRVAFFVSGVGLGMVIPATNMLVARTHPERRGAALNVLNLCWGLGAAGSPIIVSVFQRQLGFRGALFLIAALCVTVLFMALASVQPALLTRVKTVGSAPGDTRRLLVSCALLFIYIGAETSIGGWIAAQLAELGSLQRWMGWATAAFWASLIAGRALATGALRLCTERRLMRWSLLLAGMGTAGLIFATSVAGVLVCVVASGLGLAPVFGLQLASLSAMAERRGLAVPGWLFACAGFGGAALPWAVGAVATATGSLRYGLCLPVAAVVLLLVAQLRSDAVEVEG